jgi:hypothetical protein
VSIEKPYLCVFRSWLPLLACAVMAGSGHGAPVAKEPVKPAAKTAVSPEDEVTESAPEKKPAAPAQNGKATQPKPVTAKEPAPAPENKEPATTEAPPAAPPAVDPDDAAAAENAEAESDAVARPVSPDPVQVYGWREFIHINGVEEKLKAKLDTGALTSSIHAEEKELFERDGKKWVRFIVTDPGVKKPVRSRIEAPLVRIARIKEPGGESEAREVVRLGFRIGERKMRGEFTLNNRSNMLAPVLIGRSQIKDLGMVDPSRTHLAEQKIFR